MTSGPRWSRERAFWRRKPARDLDDELAFHIEMRASLLEQEGSEPEAARREALRRFGELEAVRAECLTIDARQERKTQRAERWQDLGNHVRQAARRLRRAPGFTVATVVMLALGIGAIAAVYAVVDGVVLRPLPYHQPDRLVKVSHTARIAGRTTIEGSDATYHLYHRNTAGVFAAMGTYRERDVNLGALGGEPGVAERAKATGVTATLLETLGVPPLHGRPLRAEDDTPGAPPVALLSYALWQRRFGGDPAVVGKSLVVDGMSRQVVGVMPPSFRFPDAAAMLWLPLRLDPAKADPGSFNYDIVARLRPGVTHEAAQRELAAHLPRLLDEFPSDIPRDMWAEARLTPVVASLAERVIGDSSRTLWILFASVSLLLFVVVANVASLFLVRAEGAYRDLAIRAALGGGPRALATGYVLEAVLLAIAGGALGLLLAQGAVTALGRSAVAGELPRMAEVAVSWRVALFTALVALVSALLVNLLPIRRVRRIVPARALGSFSRGSSAGKDRQRARSILVVGQVALALVLVAGSALTARGFARLRDVDPGFAPAGVATLRVALTATYAEPAERTRFFDRLVARARELPGVVSAGVTDWLPLSDDHSDSVIEIEDRPLPSNVVPPDHPLAQASPEYFASVGIPLLQGRTFGAVDPERPLAEAIVSRAFARQYWGDASPLGKRVRQGLDGEWSTIVGVVGDVHMERLDRPAEQMIYFPLVSASGVGAPRVMSLTLRVNGDAAALFAPARAVVRDLDPSLAVYGEEPLAARVGAATARVRFIVLVLGAASVIALLIGMVGLYGVLSYSVTLRQREIGVRMALGASPHEVLRMIAGRGLLLAGIGIGCGLLASIAATRVLRGMLHDVSPTDPIALGGTCAILLAVAALASWIPARRAAGIGPMEAMRRE